MKIGIVGAGGIAQTYGALWQRAGHAVTLSGRDEAKAAAVAESMEGDIRSASVEDVVAEADAFLLAVNYASVGEAIRTIADRVRGKIVIDATNPLVYTDDGTLERAIADDAIAGVVMQEALPEARVVKALTTMWTGYVEKEAHRADPRAAMGYAGDDAAAKDVVRGLIADAGLEPVDLGTLAESRPLDPPSPIWNHVLTVAEIRDRVDRFRRGELPAGPLPGEG